MWQRTTVIVSQSLERMCTSSPHTAQCNWCPTSTTYASVLLFCTPSLWWCSSLLSTKGLENNQHFWSYTKSNLKYPIESALHNCVYSYKTKSKKAKGKFVCATWNVRRIKGLLNCSIYLSSLFLFFISAQCFRRKKNLKCKTFKIIKTYFFQFQKVKCPVPHQVLRCIKRCCRKPEDDMEPEWY